MSEISLDGVLDALNAQPLKSSGGGRVLMVIAARRGEGVSTIVQAAATSSGANTTYAIDLDLRRNALVRAFAEQGPPLGPQIDGRLGGHLFYRLQTADGHMLREHRPAFSYHRIGRSRSYVGAFDGHAVPEGGRVLIASAPDYWNAARAGGALVLIDAPALERSQVGLRIASHMDGVVLVVGSGAGAAPAAMAAKTDLLAAGANLIGLVYAGASGPVMAMERMLRKAG